MSFSWDTIIDKDLDVYRWVSVGDVALRHKKSAYVRKAPLPWYFDQFGPNVQTLLREK